MIKCPCCAWLYANDGEPCESCGLAPVSISGFAAWEPSMARKRGCFKPEFFEQPVVDETRNAGCAATTPLPSDYPRNTHLARSPLWSSSATAGFMLHGIAQTFSGAKVSRGEIFVGDAEFAAKRMPETKFSHLNAWRTHVVGEPMQPTRSTW